MNVTLFNGKVNYFPITDKKGTVKTAPEYFFVARLTLAELVRTASFCFTVLLTFNNTVITS